MIVVQLDQVLGKLRSCKRDLESLAQLDLIDKVGEAVRDALECVAEAIQDLEDVEKPEPPEPPEPEEPKD